ncbi:hypothetical protein E2562_020548 [Oryza meyeriana var. granulata]|uniref:Amidase domain-containing protein n=1 Tax=Oryza meyeriana var. granulata TaxID=110450 RepID=A0A6G1EAY4_9ORYZ|nr:hypothetical protein E2562_020548 [Oryza meyeriana var. granulata]
MGREAHQVLDLVLDDVEGILEVVNVADLAEVAKLWGYSGSARGAGGASAVARGGRGSSAGESRGAGEAAPATRAGLEMRLRRSMLSLGFKNGSVTSKQLVLFYLDRIARLDLLLHAVIKVNPDALAQATLVDAERAFGRRGCGGPLHGVPVLPKDNIATHDRLNTTAGSHCSAPSSAVTPGWLPASPRRRHHPRQDQPHRVVRLP